MVFPLEMADAICQFSKKIHFLGCIASVYSSRINCIILMSENQFEISKTLSITICLDVIYY